MNIIILFACGSLAAAQFEHELIPLIVNGTAAIEGQFPWMAALFYDGQFHCSSSIISPRTMLTAAHCVVNNGVTEKAEYFCAVANYRMSADEVLIRFKSVIPHPSYSHSNGSENDIAILITTEPIVFSDDVKSACIAHSNTPLMQYKNATAMGWGFTNAGTDQESQPDVLQYVALGILPNHVCSLTYGTPIDDHKICGGLLSGICKGDSGGPLVHLSADKPPVEIGVASFYSRRYGCGSIAPGVWTRVSSYNDFILQNSVDKEAVCRI